MNLFAILRSITSHPLTKKNRMGAVWRFFKWQMKVRVKKAPQVCRFTEKTKLVIERGMTGATGNIYCGLQDFEDMGFLLHFLRPGDLFVDIGANIGSYTILASGHAGARSIAIEPTPSTFKSLTRNISINELEDRVTTIPAALGAEEGSVLLAISNDTMNNHVAFLKEDSEKFQVRLLTLDSLLEGKHIPALIKIDVEGYEAEVLKGAIKTLQNLELKVIIIELMGLGERYNVDEKSIHDLLLKYDFQPVMYDPFQRRITIQSSYGGRNTIYIRDEDFVNQRIQFAEKVNILNQAI